MPYTAETFANNVNTTVNGGSGGAGSALLSTDTTLLLPSGVGASLPTAGPSRLVVGNLLTGVYEVMTWATKSGDTLSGLVRGLEGTSALTWAYGTAVAASTATAGSFATLYGAINQGRVFLVDDYGAVGNGTTDDGPAARAAVAAARAAGGGIVRGSANKTYDILPIANPTDSTQHGGIFLYSNIILDGMGPSTVWQLDKNAQDQAALVQNAHVTGIGGNDSHIQVMNCTLNGNSAQVNTTNTVDRNRGIHIGYARDVRIINVTSKNCLGTTAGANGPHGTTGEGHHIICYNSTDVLIQNCIVFSDDGGPTGSGIAASDCEAVRIANCVAHDMLYGWGITTYDCSGMSITGCNVYKCAQGIFSEIGTDVTIEGCTVGGTAPFQAVAYPFTLAQKLGLTTTNVGGISSRGTVNLRVIGCHSVNNQVGLLLQNESSPARNQANTVISGCRFDGNANVGFWANNVNDVTVIGCSASSNGGSGFYTDTITSGWVRYIGCTATGNTGYGYECHGSTSPYVRIRECLASGNTLADAYMGAASPISGALTAPAMPASGTAYTNIFSVPVTVYIAGGTVTAIAINGTTLTNLTSGTVRLGPGDTITLTYSAAPAWVWFAE